MIEIIVTDAAGVESKFSFVKQSIMIGRAAGNDVQIQGRGVSRYHTRLVVQDSTVEVQDLDSTNGTLVNAEEVSKAEVGVDDIISVGDATLRVRFGTTEMQGTALIFSNNDQRKEVLGTLAVDQEEMDQAVEEGLETVDIGEEGGSLSDQIAAKIAKKRSDAVEDLKNSAIFKRESISEAVVSDPVEPPIAQTPVAQTPVATIEEKVAAVIESSISEEDGFYWQSLRNFLSPVWHYITDDNISEIMINGHNEVYIEKAGQLSLVTEKFTPDQLQAAVLNIAQYVGRRVSEEEPYLDARLPDGSRVAIMMPPCSRKGVSVSIRKFSQEQLTIEKLMSYGSISQEMAIFLKAAVALKKNIIISGGTSSGKTSLLNVVSGFIPANERILTIEDSAELQLSQDHVVPLETRPPDKKGRGQVTIRDLVKASLRMRPDRIIVGEIRGGEAIDLLQAMNTGHSGSMATVHASSPAQALTRLETLALFSGLEIPMSALREQVSSAVDLVVQASRLPDHSRKVTHISEVGMLNKEGSYQVRDIFKFVRTATENGKIVGQHLKQDYRPSIIEEMEVAGLDDALALFK